MPTSKEINIAIRGSISKWTKIFLELEADKGVNDCPLCDLFFNERCEGCPIKKKSGQRFCKGTPYSKWTKYALRYGSFEIRVFDAKSRRLAKRMLIYLINILDKRRYTNSKPREFFNY